MIFVSTKIYDLHIGQIVKSLVFETGQGLCRVLCSGANSVDTEMVAVRTNSESVDMASPDRENDVTGGSIGGVPPLTSDLQVLMDDNLLEYVTVWAAAGTPEAVFSIESERLESLSGASVETFRE